MLASASPEVGLHPVLGLAASGSGCFKSAAVPELLRLVWLLRPSAKRPQERQSGPQSAEKISKLYTNKIKWARGVEHVSPGFVDTAVTVYKRVFSNAKAALILEWVDENMFAHPPLTSIYAYQAIVDRGRSPEGIGLVTEGLIDALRMGFIDRGELTVGKLRDPKRSYLEVLLLKDAVKVELLTTWIQDLPVERAAKDKAAEVFASVESVRRHYSPYPALPSNETVGSADAEGAVQPAAFDSSWQVCFGKEVQQVFEVIDELVYSATFDGRYKDPGVQ